MKTLMLLIIICNLCICTTNAEDKMNEKTFILYKGDIKYKKVAIELLDKVLKEQGDLGVYGGLTGGINTLKKDMNIEITEEKDKYSISISPKSQSGHDFSFSISKKSGKISGVVAVGNILPPPDFEK